MKFKLKDHVRVKDGVSLEETGELISGWVGEIVELPESDDDNTYMIELDTLSLQQLPDKYMQNCIENGNNPFYCWLEEENLELSVRRDTDSQRAAQQSLLDHTYNLPDEDDELDKTVLMAWCAEFEKSTFFSMLDKEDQNEVDFTIDLFSENAFNYRSEQPEQWTKGTVREVCLDLIPKKLTAEIEQFHVIGKVLTQFFAFLHEHQLHTNALQLHQEIQKIIPDMIRNAQNPNYWGMSKSMMMGALGKGIDLSNEKALNKYFLDYQAEMQAKRNHKPTMQPARQNPFKNLSRNQVIQVKYPDGKVVEGKFKRLETDLLSGACELIV
ncbi:MAG: hypothetical protein RIR11_2539 [Bacteroidota bacterium]|jgi:hypothetical protein